MLTFRALPPGFICVIKTQLSTEPASALSQLHLTYQAFDNESAARDICSALSPSQVNYILWKCSPEEQDWSDRQRDVYDVPGFGKFCYAGLGSLAIEFKRMGVFNQLGHAIFNNIRNGDWLIDYHCKRLHEYELPDAFTAFCLGGFNNIMQLPRGSIPKHIVKFILGLFHMLKFYVRTELFSLSTDLQSMEDSFIDNLAFTTTQFFGNVKSTQTHLMVETMSAGLPHFAVGYARCWGRDTFIAFKGMFLRTGRYREAADLLATYAGTMQHGLIPNLLDRGRNCRYNARDATWWFLQAFKDYFISAPDGELLLSRDIQMVFQKGDHAHMTFVDIIQTILQSHAQGITFREYNAGQQLDTHMKPDGFNIHIVTDPATGFVYGGNQWNCGTWMDKMGSSDKARNKGVPATPRDGADIEIIGLLYSVVSFLRNAVEAGKYPYEEVTFGNGEKASYGEWAERIQTNFEPYFWIPEEGASPQIEERHVRVRGIYKDVLGSSNHAIDYMFRPNQCIAMAVAPELFDRDHALVALKNIDAALLGDMLNGEQLGVKTLCPEDSLYRSFYDNTDDSADYSIAQGFSYHNGPEWLWPLGFALLAKLHFQQCSASHIMKHVVSLRKHIAKSQWMSLPELTNSKGAFCKDSAPAQAWSVATLLDALLETPRLEYED